MQRQSEANQQAKVKADRRDAELKGPGASSSNPDKQVHRAVQAEKDQAVSSPAQPGSAAHIQEAAAKSWTQPTAVAAVRQYVKEQATAAYSYLKQALTGGSSDSAKGDHDSEQADKDTRSA